MRHRRFPVVATLIVLALAGFIGYMAYMDVDVPGRAWQGVGEAVARLGNSLSLIGQGERSAATQPPAGGQAAVTQAPGGQSWLSRLFGGGAQPQEAAMPMLVSAEHPVSEGYQPQDLVLMRDYCDPAVVYIKGADIQGDRTAVDALMVMLRAAIAQGVDNWQISAGYRSLEGQQQVWDEYVASYRNQGLSGEQAREATAKYVARPGASEHHTGLAFDVTVPGESFPLTKQSQWLAQNCWDYGFIIRYTAEKQAITGISAEPWHIRYVGLPHSTSMRDSGQCLEEYLGVVSSQ